MYNSVKFVLALALGCVGYTNANADTFANPANQNMAVAADSPLYTCDLTGDISGASIGFVWGGQYLSGDGVIVCHTAEGETVSMPVTLKLISGGWAFDLTFVRSLQIHSVGIGINEDPSALLQTYSLGATAGATLIKGGVDFDLALKASPQNNGGVAFEVGVKGKDALGLGVRLHAMVFVIERR